MKNMYTQLNIFFNEIIENYNVSGISVNLIKNKKSIYKNYFGFKNIDTKEKINKLTLFHTASISKTFVATGIVKLIQEQKIKTNTKICDILPYFELSDTRYKEITIEHILTHTSGIPDTNNYNWDKPQYNENSLENYIKSLKKLTLLYTPGEKFSYSNIAYEILGNIISYVSKKEFEKYMKEEILKPLKMKQSTFFKPEIPHNLISLPHIFKEKLYLSNIYPYNRIHSPSSTLHSNVTEMENWIVFNLSKGTLNNNIILNQNYHKILWKKYFHRNTSEIYQYCGYSWFIGNYNNYVTISHFGSDVGFKSALILLPDIDSGLILLSNCENIPLPKIVDKLLATLKEF